MSSILLTGSDERLLKTRADVLRQTGAEILSVPAGEVMAELGQLQVDVVVLCHTTGATIANEVVSWMKAHRPVTKVLLVKPNAASVEDFGRWNADGTVPSAPAQLVRGVEGALAARRQREPQA